MQMQIILIQKNGKKNPETDIWSKCWMSWFVRKIYFQKMCSKKVNDNFYKTIVFVLILWETKKISKLFK